MAEALGYQGVDRRSRTARRPGRPPAAVVAAPVLVAAAVVVASIAYGSARVVTPGAVASVLLLLAALVAVAAGLTMVVRWRLAGSALAARQGAALCVLAAAIVVARGAAPGGAIGSASRLALLVALGVGSLLLRAAVGPEVDTVTSPGRDLVVVAVGTLVVAAGLRWGLGPANAAEVASELACAAVVWGSVAVAVRRVGSATPWGVPALALAGLGLAAACRSAAQLTGWSWLGVVAATSTLLSLCWVLARSWWELQVSVRSGDRQQRHLHLDLCGTRELFDQHLHDVRNAVAGMRTADLTLRRYGPRLDDARRAMLAEAVSAELDRLEALIVRSDEAPDSEARGLEEVDDVGGPGHPVRQAEDDASTEVVDLAGADDHHVDGRRPVVARLVDDPPATGEGAAEDAGEQRGVHGHHHSGWVHRHGASVAPGEVVGIPKMDEAR